MNANHPWAHARRALCVRLDQLGDVLMTTPAIRALRESAPGRRVTLLTSSGGAAVARLVPEVDEVLVYDPPWMKATAPRADPRPDLNLIERLRGSAFDAAAIFTVYSQNPLPAALTCYLAGIPLRLAHCRENPYQLLTDWVRDPEPHELTRHEVRRQLDLVEFVGARTADHRLSLRVPEESARRVAVLLRRHGLESDGRWVVIHPGASAPSRRYPPEGFAAAARRLVRDAGCRVVFTGGAAERELVQSIRGAMGAPSISLAGRLDLGELAALIARAPVLIVNNTGPAHIAAAVGTPVVDLYALTNLQHTPWGIPSRVLYHDVPCKPCYKSVCPLGHHDCLRLVPPEAVVRAARELLDQPRAGAAASPPRESPGPDADPDGVIPDPGSRIPDSES
jgi:lipopolysaccharide heptosyltransferase II